MTDVCQLHQQAPHLYEQGIHIVSTDEMTSIQALERVHPTISMKPGRVERIEFEYLRHGTLTLIANWEIALGKLIAPSLGPTRTVSEAGARLRATEDFAAHIAQTIATDPEAGWIFIVDQLNIHKSESLVRLIAQYCGIHTNLGIKGKSGILATMQTRAAFLSEPTHRIRFVYIPKHTSWLNQVECWLSILVRRLLKRASFTSVEDLRERILAFIDYFNRTMAQPFEWKYKGFLP